MTAIIDGVVVTGTPEEINTLINLRNAKVMPSITTVPGIGPTTTIPYPSPNTWWSSGETRSEGSHAK